MRLSGRRGTTGKVLDVTSGPILKKMLIFAVPVILTGILQQTFNTADSIVVGRWAGADALGGVSATSSLINLIICLFNGLSVGASVAIAQAVGAGDEKAASLYSHNAVATALLCGTLVGIVGFVLAEPILGIMGTPAENMAYAVKYMRIYFCGAPFILLYNYGSAILRTTGDTKRPLLYLVFGGIVNVLLNLVFVIVLKMDSDGVAIATVSSNVISSLLVLYTLCHNNNYSRIFISHIRISAKEFRRIIILGLPAGIQSAMFSVSNVIMQSSVNMFGSAAVAGNGASASLETYSGFMNEGFSQAAMTFSGQNTGAGKYERVKTVFWQVNIVSMIAVSLLGAFIIPMREFLVGLFITDNAEALAIGSERLMWMYMFPLFGSSMMVSSACLRGMGKSFIPMIISVFGVCVVRILWVFTVFRIYTDLRVIYAVYPLTWFLTAFALVIMFAYVYKSKMRKIDNKLDN